MFLTRNGTPGITTSYGITTYLGRIFKNNEVPLEKCWIREHFEFSEPDFYTQVKNPRSDLTRHKTYNVPVGRCSPNSYDFLVKYLENIFQQVQYKFYVG